MNQQELVKQRRKTNILLAVIVTALLAWIIVAFSNELKRLKQQSQPLNAAKIKVVRDENTIILDNQQGVWKVTEPYQNKASEVVIDTLLSILQRSCRAIGTVPVRAPQHYADIIVDNDVYHVGELNQASDEVYVQHGEQWLLCDKLIASMVLAPAINFIDKQLYEGELTAIVGDFGRLTDFTGMDLSVMDIAPTDIDQLPKNAISTLIFEADGQRAYTAFLSDDSQHLLLFDVTKSLIYVIPAQDKLNAILGL